MIFRLRARSSIAFAASAALGVVGIACGSGSSGFTGTSSSNDASTGGTNAPNDSGATSESGGSTGPNGDGSADDGDDGGLSNANDAGTGTADQALLDNVQKTTMEYFWSFAHSGSGMALERSTSGDTTTTGGTGFGISAIITGVSRGWIARTDAVTRLTSLVSFLGTADRFHGAWSHWIDGNTGHVIPFSSTDDGGDLVETAYMVEGLMMARAYFTGTSSAEAALRANITTLIDGVEWDFYATRGDGKLAWHWTPDHGFSDNLAIVGYDEALVVYVLATGAAGHPIDATVYSNTWFGLTYTDGQTYDGYTIPIGPSYGGPLFFTHYSFLGLDPRKMQDSHAYFWTQNTAHVLANRAYCVNDANSAYGYGPELWGLTASDGPNNGYGAWSPTNDTGVIAPTAALSSMPYAPYHSLQVLRHLFSALGDQTFKMYGFVDALSPQSGWYDTQFLAIDQGPIVAMIENYRSALFWNLGMQIPEMQAGLAATSIGAPTLDAGFYLATPDSQTGQVDLVRHPDRGVYELDVNLSDTGSYTLVVEDADSNVVKSVWSGESHPAGTSVVSLGSDLATGSYVAHLAGSSVDKRLPITLH